MRLPFPSPRGSSLMLVVVMLAIVSLLAASVLTFSQRELGAARNERSGDELLACADAGRQYILSRFNLLQSTPVDLSPVNVRLDKPGDVACPPGTPPPEGGRCLRSGHMGQVSVTGIVAAPSQTGGPRRSLRDLSNTVAKSQLGGVPYLLTVHCEDSRGRQSEVEFLVRFGI